MAWTKVERESSMWDFEKNKTLTGVYISKEENQGTKKNSTIHTFDVNGEEVTFWGSTVLDRKLKSVEEHYGFDTKVKVTYLGIERSKGGSDYKNFDVEVWTEGAVDKDGNEIDLKNLPL